MPSFMRYVVRSDHRLSLERLETLLQKADTAYRLIRMPEESYPCARLMYDEALLATLGIRVAEDARFQNVVRHMQARLEENLPDGHTEHHPSEQQAHLEEVRDLLRHARAYVAVQVAWGDREADQTEDLLEPLFALLFERWEGLLQMDDDSWHDPLGVIYSVI